MKQRKGMVNVFYAFVLGFIFSLGLIVLFQTMFSPKTQDTENKLNNIVYTMRDSLDVAKLYLENSARYSLYQAMYDNGKMGGSNKTSAEKTLSYKGVTYSLWYDDGTDYSPDEHLFTESLENSTEENFMEYTRGTVLAIFPVTLPFYDTMLVNNVNNYSLAFSAEAEGNLLITRVTDEGESIRIEKPSEINIKVNAPYYQLFEEARIIHESLKEKLSDCLKSEIETSSGKFLYVTDVEVLDDSGKCIVKVELETSRKFLVWNGNGVALEPIRLVFLERGS